MYDRCETCDKRLQKTNVSGMCAPCKSDPNVTISTTNAKRIYKLTNHEIDEANLFSFEINFHGARGIKYLLDDIIDLAEIVYSKIEYADPRKQAYLKNIDSNDSRKHDIDNTRNIITGFIDKYHIKCDIYMINMIEHFIKRRYDSDPNIIINRIKRMIKLDRLINKHIQPKYITEAQNSTIYQTYIYADTVITLDATIIKIEKYIQNYIRTNTRKRRLEKFIKENIDDTYADFVRETNIYQKYIRNGADNFDEICDLILKEVIHKKRDLRIHRKCGNFLDDAIKQDDILKIYKRYINKGGDVDITIENIKNAVKPNPQKLLNIRSLIEQYNFVMDIDKNYVDRIKYDYLFGNIQLCTAKERFDAYIVINDNVTR